MERNLPDLLAGCTAEEWETRREELIRILEENEYGTSPKLPAAVNAKMIAEVPDYYGGKAKLVTYELSFNTPAGVFMFPYQLLMPAGKEKVPVFVNVSFSDRVASETLPSEEIIDEGFGVAVVCYTDITSDGPEWDKLAAMYPENKYSWGKIGMWAFGASCVLSHLLTLPEVDGERVGIIGHSRLGKTVLWAAARDTRFSMVAANDSGCSGAGLNRLCQKENLAQISTNFPYWFCEKYASYKECMDDIPFDQHFLLAAVAPRGLAVGSASRDQWADAASELDGLEAAKSAWQLVGAQEGLTAYWLREGTHWLSRSDWQFYMKFRKENNI